MSLPIEPELIDYPCRKIVFEIGLANFSVDSWTFGNALKFVGLLLGSYYLF